jgi:hypothetical protein
MAAAPTRPPWFGNTGVQVVAAGLALYNVVRMVLALVDGRWADAFLSFAWTVACAYLLSESLRTRKELRAAAGDGTTTEPTD